MTYFVQRDPFTGLVVGRFSCEQEYAHEELAEDHPDLLAFVQARTTNKGLTPAEEFAALKARCDSLEARCAELERRQLPIG